MLSLTANQRLLTRPPSRYGCALLHTKLCQRTKALKINCSQAVSEIENVGQEAMISQTTGVEEKQQEVVKNVMTDESAGINMKKLFKKDHTPQELLELLKEHYSQMGPESIGAVAGSFRKQINNYRRDQRDNTGEMNLSLENVKEFYNMLIRLLRKQENMGSLDFLALSKCVWCLQQAKEVLQIHTEIENYESVLEDLYAQSAKIVSENFDIELPALKLTRVMSYIVEDLNENNRRYFDVLFNKLLTINTENLESRSCINLLNIFCKIECTDVEVLDRYIPDMYERLFGDKNQMLTTMICQQTTELRYYDWDSIAKIKSYLQSDIKSKNGGIIASIAQYVSTLATDADGREQLAQDIMAQALRMAEHYWVQDIVRILYYTAILRSPQEEYNRLLSVLLQKIEDNFGELSDVQLRMLRQAQIFQSSCGVQIELPQELQTMCANAQSAYTDTLVSDIRQDQYTLDVFQTIQEQYEDVQCGVTDLDWEVAIPILIENGEQKVVVQPVSEKDFVLNVPGCLLESKKAEYGILENLGYQVQKVVSQKWYEEDGYKYQVLNELSQRLDGEFVEEEEIGAQVETT